MNLSNDDVQDILSLLDSLPYTELTLETSRFVLQLRRSGGGWTQQMQVLSPPVLADPVLADPVLADPVLADTVLADPVPAAMPPNGPPSPARPAAAEPGPSPAAAAPAPSGGPPSPGRPRAASPLAGPGAAPDATEVVAPLPGTFYRAPQPGAPPFVEAGRNVDADTVVAIIETMKLMNPVYAGTSGTVTEICLDDGQFAGQGAVLMRVSARAA